MPFADTLSDRTRRRARIHAYLSSSLSCISSCMLTETATVIIFMTLLGCSESFMMLCPAFSSIFAMALMIPSSKLVNLFGKKRASWAGSIMGCSGFLVMAISPFFGKTAALVLMTGCVIYSLNTPLHNTSWFALLDEFLQTHERGRFFGTMRCIYMVVSGMVILFIGLIMGKNPQISLLQTAIAFAGIMFLGRGFFNSLFPENPHPAYETPNIRKGIIDSLQNSSLTSYSIYMLLLTMATGALMQLTFIYLKKYVELDSNIVLLLSTLSLVGSTTSYIVYPFLQKLCSIKALEITAHSIYTLIAFTLFAMDKGYSTFVPVVGGVIFMLSFSNGITLCNNSIEMLSLAKPDNRTMALAFSMTYREIGRCIAQFGTSFILGTTMLSTTWTLGGRLFSRYQTIFLIFGVASLSIMLLLPLLPSFTRKHEYYYHP
ncbi:MAG: MFS transporter [Victivallales bacterium]|nr:MFS transporter [Victivallales bacterium]